MNPKKRIGLLIAVCLGTFLASLDISIVNVALPAIQEDLHSDLSGLQWIINAYAICLSAFMLSTSALSDRFGHKRIWLIGAVVFTLGSYLCAVASNISILIIGRMIQGIAGAILIPGAMSMISYAYPDPKERVAAVGIWSAISALALVLGPLLGGLIVHHLSWHTIFSINIPIGVVAFGIGLWSIQEHKYVENAALDPIGQILSIICLGLLSYGLIKVGETGTLDTNTAACLVGFIVTLALFLMVELKIQKPILQLSLFRSRYFSSINFSSFILGFSCYSSLFFFSVFLQQVQGYSPQEAGIRMMPQFIVTGIISLFFGRINRLFNTQTLMNVGYGLAGVTFMGMFFLSPSTSYWYIGLLFSCLGISMGFAVPATGAVVMGAVTEKQFAMASATMNALRQMGMSIGVALLASVMSIQAIHVMKGELASRGLNNVSAITEQAVRYHQFADAHAVVIKNSFLSSMNSGFNLAMLIAGASCLLALFFMLVVNKQRLVLN